MKMDNKYELEYFKEKKLFFLMAEDIISQVSIPIRVVKRKIQEIQVKLRGFEM